MNEEKDIINVYIDKELEVPAQALRDITEGREFSNVTRKESPSLEEKFLLVYDVPMPQALMFLSNFESTCVVVDVEEPALFIYYLV